MTGFRSVHHAKARARAAERRRENRRVPEQRPWTARQSGVRLTRDQWESLQLEEVA